MIPEGWKVVPIAELCDSIIDCVNKTAPVVDCETPYKMIRTTNIRHGRVNTEDVRYVSKETYLDWTRRGAPKNGDILFTREAPVGEAAILDNDDGVFLGQRTMMYRADGSKTTPQFLFYSLQSSYCQKQIEDMSNGGTVTHMRVPDCGKILVRTPCIEQQKKIAQILSAWDKAITTTEQLLANSQQQKKALVQQLLTGKRRMHDENGRRFDGEWAEAPLRSLLSITKGTQRNRDTLSAIGAYPVINGGISPSGYTEEFNCDADMVTISEGGNSCGHVSMQPRPFWLGGHCYAISKSEFSPGFTFQLLKFYQRKIMRLRVGSGLPNIQKKDLERLQLFFPPSPQEQEKLALVLTNCDREERRLGQELRSMEREKKALMQQLLTGKRRVKLSEAL